MTVEELRELVAEREGYRIHWTCEGAEFATAYVVSHKGRIVGAVVFFPSYPIGEPAANICEAQDWWRADQAKRLPAVPSAIVI